MSNFDYQLHADEMIPTCPYCDEVLDGVVVNGLHAHCNQEYAIEVHMVWPEEPVDSQFTDYHSVPHTATGPTHTGEVR